MIELPIVRTHRRLPFVLLFILSISQAFDSSPRRKPVSEAMTILGT